MLVGVTLAVTLTEPPTVIRGRRADITVHGRRDIDGRERSADAHPAAGDALGQGVAVGLSWARTFRSPEIFTDELLLI